VRLRRRLDLLRVVFLLHRIRSIGLNLRGEYIGATSRCRRGQLQ